MGRTAADWDVDNYPTGVEGVTLNYRVIGHDVTFRSIQFGPTAEPLGPIVVTSGRPFLSFNEATIAAAMNGYAIAHAPEQSGEPIELTPLAPTVVPAETCGVEGTVSIPVVEGVLYSQTQVGTLVTVTATAKAGYVITPGATT